MTPADPRSPARLPAGGTDPGSGPGSGSHAVGIAWLLTDMGLYTLMTVLVKTGGTSYPAVQMVFFRAFIGMLAILPLALRSRTAIRGTRRPVRHLVRVLCNATAISAGFVSLTMLPLALANAIGFLRPLVVLALAGWLLGERSGKWRWIGALLGLAGVLVMLAPGTVEWSAGIWAALAAVAFGAMSTVQTRALAGESTVVMMVFYTVGLTLFTALPAAAVWQPVQAADWPLLLGIGVVGQTAQYCFLRAYQAAPANVLAPVSYLSIIAAGLAGWLAFGEVPAPTTLAGAAIILGGVFLAQGMDRPRR